MTVSTAATGVRRWARHLIWAALCGASATHAAGIDYTLTALGGDIWRYDYTLVGSAGDPAFDEFTVYFDLPAAQQISSFTTPGGWDGLVAQVDPALPDGGYVDALHLGGPVAAGSRIAGFSVMFQAGAGLLPGAQRYELITSDTFTVVGSGLTAAVPEPGTYALMLSGLALLGWAARRQARCQGEAS